MPPKRKTEPKLESIPNFSSPAEEPIEKFAPPKPKIKKKAARPNLKKRLAKIYAETNKNGSPSALTAPPPARSKFKILIGLLIFFAFLAAVSWAGFFLFGAGQKFSEEKIELKINGPEQAQAGQNVTYRIYFNNRQRLPLGNASLEVRYPDEFRFLSANPSPTDKENHFWDLGTLTQDKKGLIEINGQIFGPANSDFTLRVFFNYRPANFNAEFQKISSFITHLNPWSIKISLTGPEEIIAGEEGEFQINLASLSNEPLANLELSLNLPKTFKVRSLEPAPVKEQNLWRWSSFPANSSTTIKFKGSFTAETLSGSQTIGAALNLNQENKIFSQVKAEKSVAVNRSALALSFLANNTSERQTANFGDKISFTLSFENIGQVSLKNVSLRAVLEAPFDGEKSFLNWPALEDKKNGQVKGEQISPAIRRGIITWTKAQIPALAEIKPKERGKIEFIIPLRQRQELNLAKSSEAKITTQAEALFGQTSPSQPASLQSNPLILLLNSDLSLSLQASLKEKKNLPPQIGQKYDAETIYNLSWALTNSWHELTDLKLVATLPENVDWKNVTAISAGEISFDETTKQVSWQLNRLPASAPKTTVSFELGLKSKESDQGKEAMLIDKTRVEAKDKATGENLLFWKEPVMTIL